jgi:hypothetical protein
MIAKGDIVKYEKGVFVVSRVYDDNERYCVESIDGHMGYGNLKFDELQLICKAKDRLDNKRLYKKGDLVSRGGTIYQIACDQKSYDKMIVISQIKHMIVPLEKIELVDRASDS